MKENLESLGIKKSKKTKEESIRIKEESRKAKEES